MCTLKKYTAIIKRKGAVPALDSEKRFTIQAHNIIEAKKIALKSCRERENVTRVTE